MDDNSKQILRGFSTIEIALALALFSLLFSSVILVSISNQNIAIDTALSTEAIQKMQRYLDEMVGLGMKDYKLLVSRVGVVDGLFKKQVLVRSLPNLEGKEVTAKITWTNPPQRSRSISLSALLFQNDPTADTCDSVLTGDWTLPYASPANGSLGNLIGDSVGTYPITDIDAYYGQLFVSINNSSKNTPTIFIFDIRNPTSPNFVSSIDNDVANNTGVNAISIAELSTGTYAFVASASSFTKGQLQIINTNPPYDIITYKIPTAIVRGSSTQGIGNQVMYANGYVYLGLTKTVSGPEFNIIDVSDIQNPFWVGGYSVGNGINSIVIKDDYAYIASPNNQELITLDISNPSNPYLVGGYNAPGSVGNGKSLYRVGDTLYLGRTITSQNPEFNILDNSTPNTNIRLIGSKDIGASINGIFIRDYLAFLLTNSEFHIYDITNPSGINQFAAPLRLSVYGGSSNPTFDCEGNYFYIGSNDFSNNGYLSIITSR